MSTATGVLVPLMLATEAGFASKWLQTRAQAASAKAKLKRLLRADRDRFGELGLHQTIEPVFFTQHDVAHIGRRDRRAKRHSW